MRIDLNCDLGESFGVYSLGQDEEVMRYVTSANVACGFHGGDPAVMRQTVRRAKAAGVAVGAHPGYPDLVGFGRREMDATPAEIEDMVLYQLGALAGIATAEGVRLQHVKPHGAMFNQAARDMALASAIARAVAAFDSTLILFGLAGSLILEAGEREGLRVASEVFADRAYEPDGSLASRRKPGSVIHDADGLVSRVVQMVREGTVVALDGRVIPLRADTVCTHGDTPGAAELTRRLRERLETEGIRVVAIGSA